MMKSFSVRNAGLLFFILMNVSLLSAQDNQEQTKSQEKVSYIPLNPQKTVLLDKKNQQLRLKTKVVLREGALEMLCCLKQTKEHESILTIDSKAYVVHTGLLALKAKPGKTARYTPEFQPPTGQKLSIHLEWKDKQGKPHKVSADQWVRTTTRRYYIAKLDQLPADLDIPEGSELRYFNNAKELSWFGIMSKEERKKLLARSADKKYKEIIETFYEQSQIRPMKADWVFAGSTEGKDDKGNRFYRAEGGDFICVANFPTAMIDISEESSSQGEGNLLYEAWTERIPPLGTEVEILVKPIFPKTDKSKESSKKATP